MHRHLISWLCLLCLTIFLCSMAPGAEIIDVSDLLTDGYDLLDIDAISGDGSTLVGLREIIETWSEEAFRWSEDEGELGLGFMDDRDSWSFPMAVSADGSIIVGYGGISEAFR